MKFELVDKFITENEQAKGPEGKKYGGSYNDKIRKNLSRINKGIYEDVDDMIYESMRKVLQNCILESDQITDSQKVKGVKAVEEEKFNEEQTLKFVKSYITPIVDAYSISETNEDDVISVSGAVYESALAIDMVKNGNTSVLKKIVEMEKEKAAKDMESDKKDAENAEDEVDKATKKIEDAAFVNKESVEEEFDDFEDFKEGEFEDEDFDIDLSEEFDEVPDEELSEDIGDPQSVLEDYLELVFERWGIEDKRMASLCIEKANDVLKERDVKSIVPDIFELSEIIEFVNLYSGGDETIEEGSMDWLKKRVSAGAKAAAAETARRKKSGELARDVAVGKFKNFASSVWNSVKSFASNAKDAVLKNKTLAGGVLAASVLGLIAAAVMRKQKDKECKGMKGDDLKSCMAKGAQKAISALRAQQSNCSKAKDPDACKKTVQKEIAKWEDRKAKYANA